MEQSDLLAFVVTQIEEMRLRYFVTGSTATIFYGEPRFTNDIDIVLNLADNQTAEFCSRFPHDEFYVSEAAAFDAVRRKSQFNILHPASGLKVDIIIPKSSPFNDSRFARIRRIHAGENLDANFASPEDAIIKKMEFYREGGSEKHLRDIMGVLKTSGNQIEVQYITQWATQLDLLDIWNSILKQTSKRG